MRRLLATMVVVLIAAAGPAPAQPADQTEIIQVIRGQLDAFQADDAMLAFSYASPGIQARFGTAERFMAMVRRSYQPVYRPTGVEFLELVPTRLGPVQRVFMVAPNGRAVIAEYLMQRQDDGPWRISAVRLTASNEEIV